MSFAKENNELISALIRAEKDNAVKNWGSKYHSLHEGYAILKEEVEEAQMEEAQLRAFLESFWDHIRYNNKDTGKVRYAVNNIEKYAKKAIAELTQVCAVCEKIRDGLNG